MKNTASGDFTSRGGDLFEEQALPESTYEYSSLETLSSDEEGAPSGVEGSAASTTMAAARAEVTETVGFEEAAAWRSYAGTDTLDFSGLFILSESTLGGGKLGWTSQYGPLEVASKTGEPFGFESVLFKAPQQGVTITVEGWNGSQLVARTTLELGPDEVLEGAFGEQFHGIDRVVITNDQPIRVDDFVFVNYFEPDSEPTTTGAVFGTAGLTGSVIEDLAPEADNTLSVIDPDPGQSGVVAQSGTSGTYGSFSISEDGHWSYALGAAAEALAGGEVATDSFTVTALDGSATETVTVTITGTDDAASFRGDTTGSVVENTATRATGRLVVEDLDAGEAGVLALLDIPDSFLLAAADGYADFAEEEGIEGAYGSFSITQDGYWAYELGASAEALAGGETAVDSFTVTSLDGSATEAVTVTITGANDAARFRGDLSDTAGSVAGDALTATGRLVVEDPDAGEAGVLAQSGTAGAYGTFAITEDGDWTYTLGDAAGAMAKGETATDRFTVISRDGSATETVAMTVTGTVEPPRDPVPADTIDVSNMAELMAMLKTASGGETIRLAPGDYGKFELNQVYKHPWAVYETPVTIVSADPDAPAVVTGLGFYGASGVVLDGILFDYDAAPGAMTREIAFQVNKSENISIRNSVFDGDLAEGVSAERNGDPTGIGLMVRDAQEIALEGNTFFHFNWGATFDNVDDLAITGNELFALAQDGFNFSTVQDVLIADNYMHDFAAAGDGGHRDMIQFWTTNDVRPSTDVVIRGNRLMNEEGDWTQSIFIRNEMVDTGRAGKEMFYQNILIEENLIWNGHTHGIMIGETDGLVVRNNTLLHNGTGESTTAPYPKIHVAEASTNVTVTGNIASAMPEAEAGWTVTGNLVVQRATKSAPNHYDDLFVNALNDGLAGVEDLQALPGGLAEGYGAEITRYDATPEALTALMRQEKDAGERATFSFDGSLSAGPDGLAADAGARFLWDFGDGTTAEGVTTSHDYAASGVYTVTLEVIAPDGSRDTHEGRVEVTDPLLLDLDVSGGQVIDQSSYAASVDDAGMAVVAGRDGGEAIRIGAKEGFEVARDEAPQIYDLDAFTLSFGFRATAPGEVLRLHTALEIRLLDTGQLRVVFTNADEDTSMLLSPRGLLDGDWHDVTLTFDGADGYLRLYVDGAHYDTTGAEGRTQPMEAWGLYVGSGVFWQTGFEGALDDLRLEGEALDAHAIAERHGALSDGLAPPAWQLDDFDAGADWL